MSKLNVESYRRLLRQDWAWLRTQPRTLEREHILEVLEAEFNRLAIYNAEAGRTEGLAKGIVDPDQPTGRCPGCGEPTDNGYCSVYCDPDSGWGPNETLAGPSDKRGSAQ